MINPARLTMADVVLPVFFRLGGGAMELRVSVRSLVHQLVHEQAKASVHLEVRRLGKCGLVSWGRWDTHIVPKRRYSVTAPTLLFLILDCLSTDFLISRPAKCRISIF